jgi:lysophospholipase L1-like esterase
VSRRVARGIAIAIAILLAFSVAEVVLRVRHRRPFRGDRDTWHEHDPQLGWRNKRSFAVRSEPPGLGRAFEVKLTSSGMRGEREVAAPAVVALGDSFTFGWGVDGKDAWPAVLDRALAPRAEVANAGVCGFGVDQMRLLLDELLERKPRVVLLSVIADDLRRATRASFAVTGVPKPLFVLGDDGSLTLTHVPVPKLGPGDATSKVDAEGSHVIWAIRDAWRRASVALSKDPEAQDERWTLGHALIVDCAKAARAKGARLAVALVPTEGGLATGDGCRRLMTGLEAEGIPFLDLYPAFEARRAKDPGAKLFFAADPHPSEEGHAIIAAEWKAFLEKRGLLDTEAPR